jgi:hypothetical protein
MNCCKNPDFTSPTSIGGFQGPLASQVFLILPHVTLLPFFQQFNDEMIVSLRNLWLSLLRDLFDRRKAKQYVCPSVIVELVIGI